MISKSVIVFWSVACLTLTMHLVSKDGQGTLIYILAMGLTWAIVVVPAALIGQLFKARKVYSPKMRMIRGGILTAVGLFAFVLAVGSQRPTAPAASQQHTRSDYFWSDKAGGPGVFEREAQPTGRGFRPWVER
jgi:hypothetical protein